MDPSHLINHHIHQLLVSLECCGHVMVGEDVRIVWMEVDDALTGNIIIQYSRDVSL